MISTLQLVVLYGAPALALWLLLWSGRYPGERLVRKLAARARRAARPRAACPPLPRWPARARRSGGRVHVRLVAGRGPPCAVVLH